MDKKTCTYCDIKLFSDFYIKKQFCPDCFEDDLYTYTDLEEHLDCLLLETLGVK